MKSNLLLLFLLLTIHGFSQTFSSFIHLDQFGYHPEAEKVAVISNPQIGYNANQSYQAGKDKGQVIIFFAFLGEQKY